MLVFKLAYNNEELTFPHDLQELKESLKKKNITIGLVESIEGKTHIIRVICDEKSYSEKLQDIVNLYISNILYRIVIDNYRKKEMFEFLIDNYYCLEQNEILEVEDQITRVLNCEEPCKDEDSIYCLNRITGIIEKIRHCITENQGINVDGFLTFRMRTLREDIERIIDKVVEKFMIDKEYEAFIRLLKTFVNIQECKTSQVIISIEPGNQYNVKDDKGNDLYTIFMKELTGEGADYEINAEDILVSGLITCAPETIVVYGTANCENKQFLETIRKVFENRAVLYENLPEENNKKFLRENN